MQKAHDIMTRALVTASPDTPTRDVARMMRDLNIGDVLVVQDGKLRGIVTDRDLAVKVLTNGADPDAPIAPYMTEHVVTGEPDWQLSRIAEEMGKHQIRRLPIVQDGTLVGIVSLGDLAVHLPKPNLIAKSLRNISEVSRIGSLNQSQRVVAGAVLSAVLTGAVLVFVKSRSGQQMRKQLQARALSKRGREFWEDAVNTLQDPATRLAAVRALEATGIPDKARDVLQSGSKTLRDPKTRKRAFELAEQAREQIQNLPSSLPRVQKRPAKRFWLV